MANNLIELDGSRISLKGEMVSLTGLWKAAGSDPSKKPAKWRELPASAELIAYVAEVVIRKSDIELFSVTRGGASKGATFAHWHIAMAYARYLDPAFAVRCNEIVRAHMERSAVPTDFPAELIEMIRRTDGIARALMKKVTKIEHALDDGVQSEPAAFTITVQPNKRSAA